MTIKPLSSLRLLTQTDRAAFMTAFWMRSGGKKTTLLFCWQEATASVKTDPGPTGPVAPVGKKMQVMPTPVKLNKSNSSFC